MLPQVDERQLVLLGKCAAHVHLRQDSACDKDLPEPPRAGEPLLGEGGIQLVRGDEAVAHEQRAEDGAPRTLVVSVGRLL
ncbi:MAG: hypothetical protein ACRDQT_05765, partial [Gaiellaceae bacterium]